MKTKLKFIIPFVVIVTIALSLILFSQISNLPVQNISPDNSTSYSPEIAATPTISSPTEVSSAPTPSSAVYPLVSYQNNMITYSYYDIVEDKKKTITQNLEGDAPLSSVMEIVSQTIFEKTLADSPINPLSIEQKGDAIYVDFKKDILKTQLGSSGEATILESIADGYLNNLPGIHRIYFSVEGADYSSSHIEFPKDQPYKQRIVRKILCKVQMSDEVFVSPGRSAGAAF